MAKRIPETPEERAPRLASLRNLKMARSAHAFVRGNTVQFYEWLENGGRTLPSGPDIWICGDCHVSNIGPVADMEGGIDIQIRDLDQSVIGNPAHDIVRLAVSLATAARGSDLPGVVTARMVEQLIDGYERAMGSGRKEYRVVDRPPSIKLVMKTALKRRWKDLAGERIDGSHPSIPLGRRFWPVTDEEMSELRGLVATEGMRSLVTQIVHRADDAKIELADAKYWVKGCSSLGRLRYALLVRVGEGDGELCLVDVKEALRAAAPRSPHADMPRDNAARVREGALHLAPNLGKRMLGGRVQGRSVFVRELRPQDLKVDIERMDEAEAMVVARYLGNVVGRAHAAQLSRDRRKSWLAELARNRPANIDAPSWLWRSVVELVQAHEGGYLEHCRRYATVAS
ncbi:MAG: DUF2252 family protein [Luteibacter sp.]